MGYFIGDSFKMRVNEEIGFWVIVKINQKTNKYFLKEIRNDREQRVLEVDIPYFESLIKGAGAKSVFRLKIDGVVIKKYKTNDQQRIINDFLNV